MKTVVLTVNLAPAVYQLQCDGLVAVPTETVYGLSANGLNPRAIEKLYEVKGRPETKPINLLIPDLDAAAGLCEEIPDGCRKLAEAFWPGPLTMILKKSSKVPDIVTAGGSTVGLRCPDHPLTLSLLRSCGIPLATPSANLSGMTSPKTVEEVLTYFNGKIPYVIDGGPCTIGLESTILDMTVTPPRILRQGGLAQEEIEKVLGCSVIPADEAKAENMTVIGITGGTGAGKTTALNAVRDLDGLVLDCDAIYHDLTLHSTAMLSEIDARFPGVVENGVLQRKKLGSMVFADEKALAELSTMTHRYVCDEVRRLLADWQSKGGRLAAIDAIALIESGLDKLCTFTAAVTAPEEVRARRIMAREGIDYDYAILRIRAQKSDEWFRANCGILLVNDFERAEDFEQYCRDIFMKKVREQK